MPIPHPMNMNVEPMVAMVAAGEVQVKFCWVQFPGMCLVSLCQHYHDIF